MGYFDSITTKDNKNITIDKTVIKNDWYQSKDFMYDENDRYWQGDDFEINENGYIYFNDEDLKDTKLTGLVSIYSDDLDYWLLIDNNKIIKAYKDMYFEELPSEAKKDYSMHFGEGHSLNVDIEKLDSKKSQRLLKKRKRKAHRKHNIFSNCKTKKVLRRKNRKKSLRLKHLLICIEKYSPLLFLDEAGAFGSDVLSKTLTSIRKMSSKPLISPVSEKEYKQECP
jgi:hypothetical protein